LHFLFFFPLLNSN